MLKNILLVGLGGAAGKPHPHSFPEGEGGRALEIYSTVAAKHFYF